MLGSIRIKYERCLFVIIAQNNIKCVYEMTFHLAKQHEQNDVNKCLFFIHKIRRFAALFCFHLINMVEIITEELH